MSQTETVLVWGTVLVLLAIPPAYGVLWEIHQVPWNRGPYRRLGRVLFSKSAVIALVLTLSLIAGVLAIYDLGRPFWYEALRLVAFALVVPVLWWQWWVYRRTRLSGDPGAGEPDTYDDHVTQH